MQSWTSGWNISLTNGSIFRSFTCPSCLGPVDSTILSTLTAHTQQSLHDLVSSSSGQSIGSANVVVAKQ
ncbi:unnamed protein product [Caenorhabditis auriculariae]|uniref:Uncharacterized protein n=1 Tax=Caenorhabditis auriculariae TaxID=2777116 RepID=A0A8S1HNF1_9PELO|nr:unnamed protein product [Caenorhabditis auriculariae]